MKAVISFILMFLALPVLAQNSVLRQGNKAYDSGKYGQAFELYEKAAAQTPEKAAYNKGTALYKLQDYGAAALAFEQSIQKPNNKKEVRFNQNAMYNLGNSAYKAGDKDKGKQAMRNAVLMDLKDNDAKENLQFMLKQEKAQNQSNQDKENPQENQEQDKQDKQGNQDKQNQNKQNQDNQKDEQQQDKQKEGQEQEQEKEQETSAQEEAESVLQMAQEHKQDLPKQHRRSNQIEKDW